MRGVKSVQRSMRLVRSRLVKGSLILLYHRIAESRHDPFSMNVAAPHFEEHLEIIRRIGRPMHLQELVDAVERRIVPPRGIVVTFDDGYADNLSVARPLLERHEIPATVFVTSGLIGAAGECWWDALARIVVNARHPESALRLVVAGRAHEWKGIDLDALLRRVHRVLRPLGNEQRRLLLVDVARWAGLESSASVEHRPLTAKELEQLAASPTIAIGAHTVTHPVLSRLGEEDAISEIGASRKTLEGIIGRPVTMLAYPYGLASDFSSQTIAAARQAGYRAACTAIPDVVWRGSRMFQLPRLWVNDWSGDAFERKLSTWLRG